MIGAWLRLRDDTLDWTNTDANFLTSVCGDDAYAEARSRAEEASDRRTARHWNRVAHEIAQRHGDQGRENAARHGLVSRPMNLLHSQGDLRRVEEREPRATSQSLNALEEALEKRARELIRIA